MKYEGDGNKYVEGLFPELKEIADKDIRQKVINCWLMTLEESEWNRIEDLLWIPGQMMLITNVQHCRGVAQLAMAIGKAINAAQEVAPGAFAHMDTVIAGALLHDVGKMLEYAGPSNTTGKRTALGSRMNHHVIGTHLAIKAGLNVEIVHCIEAHLEPEEFKRTLEAHIVKWSDYAIGFSFIRMHPETTVQMTDSLIKLSPGPKRNRICRKAKPCLL